MKRFGEVLGWAAIAIMFGIIVCLAWFICQKPNIPPQRSGVIEGPELQKLKKEMKKHGVLVIREGWDGRHWFKRGGKRVYVKM